MTAYTDMVTETAYAKINLALHVRARRDDGYHDIETLFAFVDAGDGLDAAPRHDGAYIWRAHELAAKREASCTL